MNGLERLIKLRGGMEDDMNPYARRLVLWYVYHGLKHNSLFDCQSRADLNCANALGTNPAFPIPRDFESYNISELSAVFHNLDLPARMECTSPSKISVKDTQTLNRELQENFTVLKHLSRINHRKDGLSITNDQRIEMIRDSDRLLLVERNLLTLSNISPGKFITSACISAIIFLDNNLRDVSFQAKIMGRLVTRLRTSMELVLGGVANHIVNPQSTKAIMWVLYVGSIAAVADSDKKWFLQRLVEYCDILSLKCWDDAETILGEFMWSEAWGAEGRDTWNEIEATTRVHLHNERTDI